jgi:hypothetical protein
MASSGCPLSSCICPLSVRPASLAGLPAAASRRIGDPDARGMGPLVRRFGSRGFHEIRATRVERAVIQAPLPSAKEGLAGGPPATLHELRLPPSPTATAALGRAANGRKSPPRGHHPPTAPKPPRGSSLYLHPLVCQLFVAATAPHRGPRIPFDGGEQAVADLPLGRNPQSVDGGAVPRNPTWTKLRLRFIRRKRAPDGSEKYSETANPATRELSGVDPAGPWPDVDPVPADAPMPA